MHFVVRQGVQPPTTHAPAAAGTDTPPPCCPRTPSAAYTSRNFVCSGDRDTPKNQPQQSGKSTHIPWMLPHQLRQESTHMIGPRYISYMILGLRTIVVVYR